MLLQRNLHIEGRGEEIKYFEAYTQVEDIKKGAVVAVVAVVAMIALALAVAVAVAVERLLVVAAATAVLAIFVVAVELIKPPANSEHC